MRLDMEHTRIRSNTHTTIVWDSITNENTKTNKKSDPDIVIVNWVIAKGAILVFVVQLACHNTSITSENIGCINLS